MSAKLKKDMVYGQLHDDIRSGRIKALEKLPSEQRLAEKFQVSRVTLRDSLKRLERENLIDRVHGKGTFVAEMVHDPKRRFLALHNVITNISAASQYILPGIENGLRTFGHRLEISHLQFFNTLTLEKGARLLKERHIRGIFLMGGRFTGEEPGIKILRQSELPVVLPHGSIHFDDVDNFAVMRSDMRQAFGDGLRHLSRLGHKRVGTIAAPNQNIRGFEFDEYMEFLSLNGLEPIPELVKEAPYSREPIIQATRKMILGPTPPTAIACFSDFYAIHVREALKSMDIAIPEQVALMGFCGYPGGEFMEPTLSTVDLMYEDTGRMAAELMLKSDEWIGKTSRLPLIITQHRLIERESTVGNVLTSGRHLQETMTELEVEP